jgi:hypothetical protein
MHVCQDSGLVISRTHSAAAGQQESFVEKLERSPKSLLVSLLFNSAFPAITECECFEFDRKKFPTFRSQFEDTIIEQAEKFFPKKEEMVRLLDVGAGGGYQTLVMLDKFLKAGYKNIDVTLADSCYANANCYGSPDSAEQFKKFVSEELLSKYSDATINIHIENEIQQVFAGYTEKETEPPHVILMIDIQAEKLEEKPLLSYCKDTIFQNAIFSPETLLVTTGIRPIDRGALGDYFDYGTCMTKRVQRVMEQIIASTIHGKEHGIFFVDERGLQYRKVVEEK